jgi:DNA-directed RNA polymerase specialized sigma24 family protein
LLAASATFGGTSPAAAFADGCGRLLGNFDATGSVAHRALELVRAEFEERTFQAFLRVTVGGQRPAEVADDLGISVGAVCTAKWRVLRRLREEVEGLI